MDNFPSFSTWPKTYRRCSCSPCYIQCSESVSHTIAPMFRTFRQERKAGRAGDAHRGHFRAVNSWSHNTPDMRLSRASESPFLFGEGTAEELCQPPERDEEESTMVLRPQYLLKSATDSCAWTSRWIVCLQFALPINAPGRHGSETTVVVRQR